MSASSAVLREGHRARMTHAADVGGQIAPRSRNTVRSEHNAGQSQRGIARALDIDRRMVKRIILEAA
jgi:hypothetical protein